MNADQILRKSNMRGKPVARAEQHGLKHSQLRFVGRQHPDVANHMLDRNYPAAAQTFISTTGN